MFVCLKGASFLAFVASFVSPSCRNGKCVDRYRTQLSHAIMPNLEMFVFRGPVTDFQNQKMDILKCVGNLCSSFPKLVHVALPNCNISTIDSETVESLATAGIQKLCLDHNPVLSSNSNVEAQILNLLTQCRLLGYIGDLSKVSFADPMIKHQLCLNEARSKLLSGQPVERSLWPIILANATSSMAGGAENSYTEPACSMKEPDAIYTLLKERAAAEIFR